MKHLWTFSPIALFATIIGLSQSEIHSQPMKAALYSALIVQDSVVKYTPKVKAIIDTKCYDCHSVEGEDDDAKEKLMWDDLPRLNKMDQIYAMDAIIESIEEGKMPPEEHIKKHPQAALSKEEGKILMEWADAIASKLLE